MADDTLLQIRGLKIEATSYPPAEPPQAQPQTPTLAQTLANLWSKLRNSPLIYLLLIPLVILLAIGGLRLAEAVGLGNLPVVERTYAMLTRWAGWLGIGRGRQNTPFEQASELAQRAPDAREPVQRITELYVSKRFRAPPATPGDDQSANAAARVLRKQTRSRLGRVWLVERGRRMFRGA